MASGGVSGSGAGQIAWFNNHWLKRAFGPWMWPPKPVSRSDVPVRPHLPDRHDRPLFHARKSRTPRNRLRPAPTIPDGCLLPRCENRANFMARLEAKISTEIRAALAYRDTNAAAGHMWRFLAHPFESWRNRLWRIAYLHEGMGEVDEALATYELMVREYRRQGDIKSAEIFLREMVRAAPDSPCYQRQLTETYLELGWRRHAVREFGILEQLHWLQGNIEAMEMTAAKIAELASEPLQKRSLTSEPKIWEPGDTFDFGAQDGENDDD